VTSISLVAELVPQPVGVLRRYTANPGHVSSLAASMERSAPVDLLTSDFVDHVNDAADGVA